MLWQLLWQLLADTRRPKAPCAYAFCRCNAAAGVLEEGGVNDLVAASLLLPLGGLLWLLLLWLLLWRLLWLLLVHLLVLRLVLVLWLVLWLVLRLWLLPLWLLPLLGRWPWPVLPVGSGDEGIWRLGVGHWLALLLRRL